MDRNLMKAAEVSTNEKQQLNTISKRLFTVGAVSITLYFTMQFIPQFISDNAFDFIQGMLLGINAGSMIMGSIFTNVNAYRLREAKLALFRRMRGE